MKLKLSAHELIGVTLTQTDSLMDKQIDYIDCRVYHLYDTLNQY